PKDYQGLFYGKRNKEKVKQVQSTTPTSIIQLIQQIANEPKKKKQSSLQVQPPKRPSPKLAIEVQEVKTRKPEKLSAYEYQKMFETRRSQEKINHQQSMTPTSITQLHQRPKSQKHRNVQLNALRKSLISP